MDDKKSPHKESSVLDSNLRHEEAKTTQEKSLYDDNLIIVGIGASAGGLNALQKMLPGLPAKKGMTYVIVQHLAPKSQDMLVNLLAGYTDLPVETVQDNSVIAQDTIYITPPNNDIFFSDGRLKLSDTSSTGPKPSIDNFFTSLAEAKGRKAVGIVLSGTGNDGAHGIRAIKSNNGITIAQDTDSAQFNGMPCAAIDSESIDMILPPEKIGPALKFVSEHIDSFGRWPDERPPLDYISEILDLLGKREQVDMTGYKVSTVFRRISRRAVLHRLNSMEEYLQLVKENPSELDMLYKDLLISVTSFFRDAEAFEALSEALQYTLKKKKTGDAIRVWVPACSTGEEAYSIAILISDILGNDVNKYRIQIFATDIDYDSVQRARKGLYPAAAVMASNMRHFADYFTPVGHMMSVNRDVREMVVLARQDIIKDTPFLHMDLISCRNLLIYLDSNSQKRILSLFHFCLDPGGLLFLGKSESINKNPDLFTPLDVKWKLYKRRESSTSYIPAQFQSRPVAQMSLTPTKTIRREKNELSKEREFATALMNILECCAMLTDGQGNIIYVRGDVGYYLKLPEGTVKENLNAIGMARQEIRFPLQSLMSRARKENRIVTGQDIRLEDTSGSRIVRIQVGPAGDVADPQFMVVITRVVECTKPKDEKIIDESNGGVKSRIAELEYELAATREYLQDMLEELESKSEELQTLNEELQSTNEELRASIEELGTTNEELEASNEELNTVNDELMAKSDELTLVMHGLEESEKRYRDVVQNANSAIIRWQSDGTIIFFNEYAQNFFGYRLEEVIGKNVSILVPEIDSHGMDLTSLVNDIVVNPEKFINNINENVCRNGRRVWMTWTNRAIFDDNGAVLEILAVGSDVTGQRQMEDLLKNSRKDLIESQKIAKLGSWRLDLKTNEVMWTDELFRMYGFDPELPPPPYTEHMKLFTPNSWNLLSSSLDRTTKTGIPYELELETLKKDGTHGWMWVRGEASKDSSGNITGLWGAAQDITERKQIEAEIMMLAEQRQLALDAARLGWWQYDPITRIAIWDDRYKSIFGVSGNTMPNDEILQNIIHHDDLPALWEKVESALNPESPVPYMAHYRIVRPDGELRWIKAHGLATFEGEGGNRHAVNFVGTVEDITDQKKFEITLKESEQKLAIFIENAPASIAMFDREMRYVSCSRRWLHDFNLGNIDVAGLSHYELFPELPEHLKTVHQRAMNGEEFCAKCDSFERKDGTIQWVNWEIRPWRDHDGNIGGVVIFSEDVTELKLAEEEKEQLLEKLNQAQKMESVGRLAGGVAHDYNNMLNVIMGFSELALEQVRQDDPLHEDLMEIYKAAERSAGVTRQLLAFARKQTAIPKELDLNDALEGMLKMLNRLIGENIELVWMPGRNLWPVKMDPGQIDQILANLCVNAKAAIADLGRITIKTCNIVLDEAACIDHVELVPGEYVQLTVSDNGSGMDEETLGKIFEPFFTTKKVGEGTGLGLATVYGIVKQNSSFIDVSSEYGSGTSFNIYIPKYQTDISDIEAGIPQKMVKNGRETILLVEDELSILAVTKRILEQQGYFVVTARNPLEAIRIAREYKRKIDLLVTDVIMPDMNGRDMAEKIVSFHPGLKCLFMSGYTADIIAPHGIMDEGVMFIEKPFNREKLAIKVREVLDTKGK